MRMEMQEEDGRASRPLPIGDYTGDLPVEGTSEAAGETPTVGGEHDQTVVDVTDTTNFPVFHLSTALLAVLLVIYSSMTKAGAPFLRWRISRFVDAFMGDAASCRVDCHLSKFSLR